MKRLDPPRLSVGTKVWIYDGMSPPRSAVITRNGLSDLPDTWYATDDFGQRLYPECRLFTDAEKLRAEVLDSIDLLERWERDFASESQRGAAGTADEKPDGQAENARAMPPGATESK